MIFVFLLFLLSTPAHGFLNISGSSGLLIIPTTEIQPQGSFALNYYNVGFVGSHVNINYGIASFLEAGVHLRSDEKGQRVGPSIKGILTIDETDDVEVAVGFLDFDLYAVVGGSLGTEEYKGYLGFGAGDLGGFFVGLSRRMEPIILLGGDYELPSRFVAEYVDQGINLGLQLLLSDEVGLSFGVRDILGDENALVLGLQFSTYF